MTDTEPDAEPESFEAPSMLERYSTRHEFPISLVGSALVLLGIFGAVWLAFYAINHAGPDMKPVPITMLDSGEDNDGNGNNAGEGNPEAGGTVQIPAPTKDDYAALPQNKPLPEVQAEIHKAIAVDDPNGSTPISPEKEAGYAALDEKARKALLEAAGKPGPKGNNGTNDGKGTVPGKGADSTGQRTMRWVLRFRTETGRDYLAQLRAMGAMVYVPRPDNDSQGMLFRDLKNPGPGEPIEKNWAAVAGLLQFNDVKRQSVQEVATAFGLDYKPTSFWAFFPKTLENELAAKERSHLNMNPEDIAETVFQVVVREGRAEITVVSQKPRK